MDKSFKICASCLQDEEKVPSSEWCWDCMEGLCDRCSHYHRKQKPSRYHKLSVLSKIPNFELLINYATSNCSIHCDKEILSYCIAHHTLCCETCENSSHKECNSSLVPLGEAVDKHTLSKQEIAVKVRNVEESLDLMTENLRKCLVSQGEEIIQVAMIMRQEIDKYFDKLEEELKMDLIKKHESYLNVIHKENCTVEKSGKDIEIMKATINQLPEEIPAYISFIIRSRMMGKLQEYIRTFKTSSQQTRCLTFSPVDVMSILKNTVTSLGDIAITSTHDPKSESCKQTIDPSEQSQSVTLKFDENGKTDKKVQDAFVLSPSKTSGQATAVKVNINETAKPPKPTSTRDSSDEQSSVVTYPKEDARKTPIMPKMSFHSTENLNTSSNSREESNRKLSTSSTESNKSESTASLTHKLQLSIFGSSAVATECCYLPDGRLVLVDTTNKCLMSCNDRGRQQKRVPFSQEPLDITVYDKTRLVVALGNDGMQILNIPSLKPSGKRINLGGRCTAVTHEKDNIIVAIDDKLRLVTIDGRLIHHIDHPGLVWSLSAVHQGKIYYSDFTDDDDVLHCITLTGKSVFSYKNDRLIGPTGVAVDTHGNVYVAGLSSHNVHQLTADGQLKTIILTKADGINYPRGMAYNKDKRELLLINQDRKTIQFYGIH